MLVAAAEGHLGKLLRRQAIRYSWLAEWSPSGSLALAALALYSVQVLRKLAAAGEQAAACCYS